ncbi:MAG TPA: hypothetical protein VE219_03765 [Candidatus Sulfotelmatobacter sp.]|nr:hypothetical protein [Candidatus Sulfotelmatobacter sp.]
MSDKVGKILRFVASDGFYIEDPEAVADWQDKVERLMHLVVADAGASKESRELAEELLKQPRFELTT